MVDTLLSRIGLWSIVEVVWYGLGGYFSLIGCSTIDPCFNAYMKPIPFITVCEVF
jgi:uncharacterized membrane protein